MNGTAGYFTPVDYIASGAAEQLHRSKAKEILIEGPAGTGKTRAVLEKIVALCEQNPEIRALICRQTRVSMTESVLVTLENKVFTRFHPALSSSDATRANRKSYEFPNKSEIIVGGLDNADRLMSTEFDVVALFEGTEAKEEDFEKLLTRLRNNKLPFQQAIVDCNPSFPGHWLNVRANAGKMQRLLSRHEDNPSITESYLDTLRNLTGHRRARLYEGRWVAGEGTVFPEFDLNRHVVNFPVPDYWPWYWGMDPGYDHPCAILWFTVAPNGCIYIADELYRGGLSVAQHARDTQARNAGRTVHRYYADPQHAFNRTAQSPKTIADQFKDASGITLTPWPRSTNVEGMVNRVRELLSSDMLKVFSTCTETIREFQTWSYKRGPGGVLPPGDDQFEDRDNHAMDVVKGVISAGLHHKSQRVEVLVYE